MSEKSDVSCQMACRTRASVNISGSCNTLPAVDFVLVVFDAFVLRGTYITAAASPTENSTNEIYGQLFILLGTVMVGKRCTVF